MSTAPQGRSVTRRPRLEGAVAYQAVVEERIERVRGTHLRLFEALR
jgi:hypothetical protein